MRSLVIALILALFSGIGAAQRYTYDLPEDMMKGEGYQIWGARVEKNGSGFRAHSRTRLNGKDPVKEEALVKIAAGTTGVWSWEVRAVPALVPSWEQWTSYTRVKRRAKTDDWSHPAVTWEQAFGRAYKVVNYLFGRTPLPLKLNILLFPAGTAYDKIFVQKDESAIALTFAFYYPAANKRGEAYRFAALTDSVSTAIYQYQHAFVDTKAIAAVGRNRDDRTINDEARSQCWFDATSLALTANTHSNVEWNPKNLIYGDDRLTEKQRYNDALRHAWRLEALAKARYLERHEANDHEVLANEARSMNAVLSACRALTQHPFDLTSGDYPLSQIEFVPFFPDPLPSPASYEIGSAPREWRLKNILSLFSGADVQYGRLVLFAR